MAELDLGQMPTGVSLTRESAPRLVSGAELYPVECPMWRVRFVDWVAKVLRVPCRVLAERAYRDHARKLHWLVYDVAGHTSGSGFDASLLD